MDIFKKFANALDWPGKVKVGPMADKDGDGIPNSIDCSPNNKYKQESFASFATSSFSKPTAVSTVTATPFKAPSKEIIVKGKFVPLPVPGPFPPRIMPMPVTRPVVGKKYTPPAPPVMTQAEVAQQAENRELNKSKFRLKASSFW